MNKGKTTIIGILNVTPDSFSDGGKYTSLSKAVRHARHMLHEGADIIDIGGESTRPGSELVTYEEERERVIPVIKTLRKKFGDTITISVDTWKSTIAEEALSEGANIINSLGGFQFDRNLANIVARYHCPIIMYHIKGKPKTMQQEDITYKDVCSEIEKFFESQIKYGRERGVKRDKFVLDPGIGFGKTVDQNIEILKNLTQFKRFCLPIAIGVSLKSHLGMLLKDSLGIDTKPTERLEASLAETAIAIYNGATVVRTHNVFETKKFITIFDKFIYN